MDKKSIVFTVILLTVVVTAVVSVTKMQMSPGGFDTAKELSDMLSFGGQLTELEGLSEDPFISANFPAVKKAYAIDGKVAGFLTEPVGYNGPVPVIVAIDVDEGKVKRIKIPSHVETPSYADGITEEWFLGRFDGKSIDRYLNLVKLDAGNASDIIQATGATVSSQAVVNGVNSAIGAWHYLTFGITFESVALAVPQDMHGRDENSLLITWAEGEKRISVDELAALPSHKADVTLIRTTGTKEGMKVEGPALIDVIGALGLDISSYCGIGVTGRDGYYTLIDEEKLGADIILAVKVGGKGLSPNEKPARLCLPGQMGPYWVKMVERIDLYDEVPPKEIDTLYSFDALTRDIEPYYYEYYGSKDKSIEVGKILNKFDEVDPKGFFTMASVDGLEKNETISLVRDRYFIKTEGMNAPMNIAPNFKLGMNVKEMAWFSTTKDAVFFPAKMSRICRSEIINGAEMMMLEDVFINTGIKIDEADVFLVIDAFGAGHRISGSDVKNCYIAKSPGTVCFAVGGDVVAEDFLCIKRVEADEDCQEGFSRRL